MTPVEPAPTRLTAREYLAMVERGTPGPDDRVELLEGVIVAMSPQNTSHSGSLGRLNHELVRLADTRAVVRIQMPFLAGAHSVLEPDVALVPGVPADYDDRHPDRALLVVEVADTSLHTDRVSKAAIYAAAGVPQYLVVSLPDDLVEVFESPDRSAARYARRRRAVRGDEIALIELAPAMLRVDAILPGRRWAARTPPEP